MLIPESLQRPALDSLGTAARRFFYGPRMDRRDIALLKETRLSESKVEFRMETFNLFNHAQFFGPNTVEWQHQ